jgi:hypothetical protein
LFSEKIVNGVPDWKLAIPLISQPSAILRRRPGIGVEN